MRDSFLFFFLFFFFCLFSHTIPSLCIIKFNYHNLKDYHSSIIIITHYIFALEVKLMDWDIHDSTLLSNKERLYYFLLNIFCCLSPIFIFINFHLITIYHLLTWEFPFLYFYFILFSHIIHSLCIIKFNYHNLKDYHSSIIIITHYIFPFEVKLVDWDIHNSNLLYNKARLYYFLFNLSCCLSLILYLFVFI